ncbi:MAG: hypothetical protein WBB39_04015 [Candidatus Saccharimonadales bacterium]
MPLQDSMILLERPGPPLGSVCPQDRKGPQDRSMWPQDVVEQDSLYPDELHASHLDKVTPPVPVWLSKALEHPDVSAKWQEFAGASDDFLEANEYMPNFMDARRRGMFSREAKGSFDLTCDEPITLEDGSRVSFRREGGRVFVDTAWAGSERRTSRPVASMLPDFSDPYPQAQHLTGLFRNRLARERIIEGLKQRTGRNSQAKAFWSQWVQAVAAARDKKDKTHANAIAFLFQTTHRGKKIEDTVTEQTIDRLPTSLKAVVRGWTDNVWTGETHDEPERVVEPSSLHAHGEGRYTAVYIQDGNPQPHQEKIAMDVILRYLVNDITQWGNSNMITDGLVPMQDIHPTWQKAGDNAVASYEIDMQEAERCLAVIRERVAEMLPKLCWLSSTEKESVEQAYAKYISQIMCQVRKSKSEKMDNNLVELTTILDQSDGLQALTAAKQRRVSGVVGPDETRMYYIHDGDIEAMERFRSIVEQYYKFRHAAYEAAKYDSIYEINVLMQSYLDELNRGIRGRGNYTTALGQEEKLTSRLATAIEQLSARQAV